MHPLGKKKTTKCMESKKKKKVNISILINEYINKQIINKTNKSQKNMKTTYFADSSSPVS